jgi:N-formylglutamate amidohydrolase
MDTWTKIQKSLDLLWELRHAEDDLMAEVADAIEELVQLLAETDPFIAQLYRTYEARWERQYAFA